MQCIPPASQPPQRVPGRAQPATNNKQTNRQTHLRASMTGWSTATPVWAAHIFAYSLCKGSSSTGSAPPPGDPTLGVRGVRAPLARERELRVCAGEPASSRWGGLCGGDCTATGRTRMPAGCLELRMPLRRSDSWRAESMVALPGSTAGSEARAAKMLPRTMPLSGAPERARPATNVSCTPLPLGTSPAGTPDGGARQSRWCHARKTADAAASLSRCLVFSQKKMREAE